jgi:hypothetical protein
MLRRELTLNEAFAAWCELAVYGLLKHSLGTVVSFSWLPSMLRPGLYIELWVAADSMDVGFVLWLMVWYTCAFSTCFWMLHVDLGVDMPDRLFWGEVLALMAIRLPGLALGFKGIFALATASFLTYCIVYSTLLGCRVELRR